jgi:C-terminal processing protease CtpA/Prc
LDILTYLSSDPIPTSLSSYRDNSALYLATYKSPALRWREVADSPYAIEHKAIFNGPVVMLIDAQTFSAGEDTAAAFKSMHRGKIVGMPSGGSTGQPLVFDLPGGGIARICIKRDRYRDGSDFVGVGVLPDEQADITIDDARNGTDSVMAKAMEVLVEEMNAQQKSG